jgi:hypothetical protein
VAPETIIITASLVCLGLVLVMVRLTRRFAGPPPISVTAEWLDQLSIETTNLLCLVGEEDCQSVRTHLRHLRDDFRLVCMAIKVIMVHSEYDRPDLARVLVWTQMKFAYRMVMVRCQLAWDRFRFSRSRPRP